MKDIKETKTISELINSFTFGENSSKGKSLSDTIKQSTLFSFWEDIVGFKLAKFTKPTKIKYSKLYVSAKSPTLIQELNLTKQKIIKKINTYSLALGFEIKDIIFDYKNYNEDNNEEFPPDNLPEFFNEENLSEIKLNKNYETGINKAVDKIEFLSASQKEHLRKKIINAKKAKIKREE